MSLYPFATQILLGPNNDFGATLVAGATVIEDKLANAISLRHDADIS